MDVETQNLLRSNRQLRLVLGTWGTLRHVGFHADDIYVFIGKNYGVVLKTQGKEFTMAFEEIEGKAEDFHTNWMRIAKSVSTIPDELANTCMQEWHRTYDVQSLLMSIHSKGILFSIPREPGPAVH